MIRSTADRRLPMPPNAQPPPLPFDLTVRIMCPECDTEEGVFVGHIYRALIGQTAGSLVECPMCMCMLWIPIAASDRDARLISEWDLYEWDLRRWRTYERGDTTPMSMKRYWMPGSSEWGPIPEQPKMPAPIQARLLPEQIVIKPRAATYRATDNKQHTVYMLNEPLDALGRQHLNVPLKFDPEEREKMLRSLVPDADVRASIGPRVTAITIWAKEGGERGCFWPEERHPTDNHLTVEVPGPAPETLELGEAPEEDPEDDPEGGEERETADALVPADEDAAAP